MYIAKRDEIRRRREALGLNAHQLAKKAQLPGNAVYRIEKGLIERTQFLRAQAIAQALKCKVTDIFDEPQKGERRKEA